MAKKTTRKLPTLKNKSALKPISRQKPATGVAAKTKVVTVTIKKGSIKKTALKKIIKKTVPGKKTKVPDVKKSAKTTKKVSVQKTDSKTAEKKIIIKNSAIQPLIKTVPKKTVPTARTTIKKRSAPVRRTAIPVSLLTPPSVIQIKTVSPRTPLSIQKTVSSHQKKNNQSTTHITDQIEPVSQVQAALSKSVQKTFGAAVPDLSIVPVKPHDTVTHPTAKAITAIMKAPIIVPPPRPAGKLVADDYELPRHYDATTLTLMARDPYWVHAYWNIAPASLTAIQKKIGPAAMRCVHVIRMYDVSFVNFDGHNANHWFDIEVAPHAQSWNINLWRDNVAYRAEYGLRTLKGVFHAIVRSNVAITPRSGQSERTDVIWISRKEGSLRTMPVMVVESSHKQGQSVVIASSMQPDTMLETQVTPYIKPAAVSEAYYAAEGQNQNQAVSGSYNESTETAPAIATMPPDEIPNTISGRCYFLTDEDIRAYYRQLVPVIRRVRRRVRRTHGMPLVVYIDHDKQTMLALPARLWQLQPGSSMAGASENMAGSSEYNAPASDSLVRSRKFFFEIGMELIVYGRTEPDAGVYLGDQAVVLRSDGTFTMRYALPDGHIPFNFTATARDGEQTRCITSAVERSKTDHV